MWVTTDPTNTWHIVVTDPYGKPSFIAPPLAMWPAGETPSTGGIGLGQCVSHGSGGDSCAGPFHARDGTAEVAIAAGTDVTVALQDGWRITQARVTAADRAEVRADPLSVATVDAAFFEDGGDQLAVSLDRLPPGEWIVRVSLNGAKGSDTFGAVYDIPVNIAD